MFVLYSKNKQKVPIKIWRNNITEVESSCVDQAINVANHPAIVGHVALMPDCHLGYGMPVGGVAGFDSVVIPNAVGVDIACLDGETEFLSPNGWKKIKNFNNDTVLQYHKEDDTANFVNPLRYVEEACCEFYHFQNSKGLDQMLSLEHKMLIWKGYKKRGYKSHDYQVSDFINNSFNLDKGYFGIKTAFQLNEKGVGLSDNEIKFLIMLCADGCVRTTTRNYNRIEFHFTKERKIDRCVDIINSLHKPYKKHIHQDNSTTIIVEYKMKKDLNILWKANQVQLKTAYEESLLWDGHKGYRSYYSTSNKIWADVIQFAFASNNIRAGITKVNNNYIVTPTKNNIIGITQHEKINVLNGKKYCFTVPSGYFVIRRNGKISITGNCGMLAVRTNLVKQDFTKESLKKIITQIKRDIPTGKSHQKTDKYKKEANILVEHYQNVCRVRYFICNYDITVEAAYSQLGTLGGGNHFIEIQSDENDMVWIMIHSGSRNLGYTIANKYHKLAQKLCNEWKVDLPHKDLAHLPAHSTEGKSYRNDMQFCMDFSYQNRLLMLDKVLYAMGRYSDKVIKPSCDIINIHHNYVALESHKGKNLYVHRKGATSAKKGQLGIIPGCFMRGTRILMSDGTYRNIENVKIGDYVICKKGISTKVVNIFNRGYKNIIKYKTLNSPHISGVTKEHKHLYLDLDLSKNFNKKYSRKYMAKKFGELKWEFIKNISERSELLFPKNVYFNDMKTYFNEKFGGYNVQNTYELGYIFGTFLGDGTSFYKKSKGGQITWVFSLGEDNIADKLKTYLFKVFKIDAKIYKPKMKKVILVVIHKANLGKAFTNFTDNGFKKLPYRFWVNENGYLQGLYDGLIDSDGHIHGDTKKFTNTSCVLVEQFSIIHYLLFGYLPSINIRQASVGGLNRCNIDNCKTSYKLTSLKNPNAILLDEFQMIKLLNVDMTLENQEVFDIEVKDDTHSFIANNVIVHNSMGDASFIVKGKGNTESLMSCSHGAGRVMSRTQAKATFSLDDFKDKMKDVVSNDVNINHIDESPMAYKNIETVMSLQTDNIDIVHTLSPIANCKE